MPFLLFYVLLSISLVPHLQGETESLFGNVSKKINIFLSVKSQSERDILLENITLND